MVEDGFDIIIEPKPHKDISDENNPDLLKAAKKADTQFSQLVYSYDRPNNNGMQVELHRIEDQIYQKYPSLVNQENNVGLIMDLVAGPYRVPIEAMQGTEDDESKEVLARVQHNLVHALLYAESDQSNPEFTKLVYDTMSRLHTVANSKDGRAQGFHLFEAGVLSQTEVERVLIESGSLVIQPDYSQDPYELDNPDDNEIRQLDINNGIDIIAARDKIVGLLDAKGRHLLKTTSERRGKQTERFMPDIYSDESQHIMFDSKNNIDRRAELPDVLNSYTSEVLSKKMDGVSVIKKGTVFVPTSSAIMNRVIPNANTDEARKLALYSYGRLEAVPRQELSRLLTIFMT